MDKKAIFIIAGCLVLTMAVVVINRFGSGNDATADMKQEMFWMKCTDKSCAHEYQTSEIDYSAAVAKKQNAESGVTCPKCGKDSVFKAIKCEKCGNIFLFGSVPQGDFIDRCPKCGFSKMEQVRRGN